MDVGCIFLKSESHHIIKLFQEGVSLSCDSVKKVSIISANDIINIWQSFLERIDFINQNIFLKLGLKVK